MFFLGYNLTVLSLYLKFFLIIVLLVLVIYSPSVFAVDDTEFMQGGGHVSCGNNLIKHMPSIIPKITKSVYDLAMILTPVILVVMGTVDLVKGIMSSKEDEMKKGKDTFIQRLVIAVLIFVVALIGLVGFVFVTGESLV